MDICDYKCLSCHYDDCINNELRFEDYRESRDIDIYCGVRVINEKERARQKKYRENYREEVRARRRKYYETHREEEIARQKNTIRNTMKK